MRIFIRFRQGDAADRGRLFFLSGAMRRPIAHRVPVVPVAVADLNGRYFGGRVVRASLFDEERFQRGHLA